MAHTPGPWKVCRGASCWFVTAPSEAGAYSDATIAEFREVSHGAMHAHRAEHDARLFAAAPDLLAALRSVMRFALPITALDVKDLNRARDAIRNAEGDHC